ncbi:MAG TPA: hypothetical protein VN736_13650 [Candidatus Limnocylindrales bacterium]|nr:hypothetical protein [Candidatus Limnocylindrales bacterium]
MAIKDKWPGVSWIVAAALAAGAFLLTRAANSAAEIDLLFEQRIENQWKTDPASCLEALHFFALNNTPAALQRLERGQPREVCDLYEAMWAKLVPYIGERYGFPAAFCDRVLPSHGGPCADDEVKTEARKQLKGSSNSLSHFLEVYGSAAKAPDRISRLRLYTLALYELAYPQRYDRKAIATYRRNWGCAQFGDQVEELLK